MKRLHPKKIPPYITRCLWSYDPRTIDLRWDKELIISQVLNYGNWKGLQWLFRTYPERAIREVVTHPRRGLWLDRVLNFWCLMLKIQLPKQVKERAIFRIDPQLGRRDMIIPRGG